MHRLELGQATALIIIPGFADTLLTLLPLIVITIIYYRTPRFYDHFMVFEEMKRVFILVSLSFVSYVIWIVLQSFLFKNKDDETERGISSIIEFTTLQTINLLIICTQTFWVVKQLKPLFPSMHRYNSLNFSEMRLQRTDENNNNNNHTRNDGSNYTRSDEKTRRNRRNTTNSFVRNVLSPVSLTRLLTPKFKAMDDNENNIDESEMKEWSEERMPNYSRISLMMVLSHPQAFELFMQHLNKEFSVC